MMLMSRQSAIYEEYPPCAPLLSWVAYYWRYWAPPSGGRDTHPIPPEAGITVTVLPAGESQEDPTQLPSITAGPQRTSVDVPASPGATLCGVRFWPGTGPAFLNIPPADLVDRMVPTPLVAPQLDQALSPIKAALANNASPTILDLAKILDEALVAMKLAVEALDPTMLTAIFRLINPSTAPSNHQLYEQARLSARQFRRRFKRVVGLSPREFRRLRRIRATLAQAALETTASWIDLAAEHGYADQAHLCREFQRSSGRSPKTYRNAIRHIEHTLVDR